MSQNSYAVQMKNVNFRWGKRKIFEWGSALLIDTNFTSEKKHIFISVKKYVSMNIYQWYNGLLWILLIDVWYMYKRISIEKIEKDRNIKLCSTKKHQYLQICNTFLLLKKAF